MADSSIVSSFRFLSYKIDEVSYSLAPRVGNLSVQSIEPEKLDVEVHLRHPQHMANTSTYICGLMVNLSAKSGGETSEALFNMRMAITGVFSTEGIDRESDPEQQFVKYQAPTILFPYLRGAMTTLLSNAGFGGVVFPLINVYHLAREANLEIQEL